MRGCCTNICARRIISALLLSCLARSTMLSAASCWSQFLPAARSEENAVWEIVPHCAAPPAAVCVCGGSCALVR